MSESVPNPEQPDASGGSSSTSSTPGGPAQRGGIDLGSINKLDLGIVGAGVVALLASFMPYYTVSFGGFGGDSNAWEGFFGWFGALCAFAGAAVLAAHLYGVKMPVPVRLAVLGLFGLGLLCTLLALFVFPGGGCNDGGGVLGDAFCEGYDEGHGFGYWLALLSTIAGTALAAMRRTEA